MSADLPGNGTLKSRPQSAEQIRAELERARQQIQSSAALLREEVAVATDWRAWYRRRPAVWIGAAVALGFYLGSRR